MTALLLLAVLAALTACSGEDEPGAARTPENAEPATVLGGSVILTKAADGVAVAVEHINVEGAAPRGGVVLAHMLGRTRADWAPLVETLIGRGLEVVALDLRGHGQSVAGGLDYKSFGTQEWLGCAADIRAALDLLAERVEGRYFLIGASIGANLALIEAAGDERVAGAILLSPGSDYHGIRPGEYAELYGGRPALLVAAGDDGYSEKSAAALAELLSGAEVEVYPDGGHGTQLFASRPELRALIGGWLERQLAE